MTKTNKKDFARIATQYAKDVVAGKIPACKWVKLACERHLKDLKRSKTAKFAFRFDAKKAARICKFSNSLQHTKGDWQGQPIDLEPWQIFILASLYGWVEKKTGFRRFRRALVIVPRKNGKSLFAAIICLYMLCADGEKGAEIYAGATSEKQAWHVFRPAKDMARNVPGLKDYYGIEVNASNLNILKTGSRLEPLIGKPGDGGSPSCAVHDEYHEHKTDEQVDTIKTGMGARSQPLQFIITTAGFDVSGPCYAMQLDLQQVLEGRYKNERFFGIIYTIDEDDDWSSPEALVKANPNLGVSVQPEYYEAELAEALHRTDKQAVYKTKYLDVWVSSRSGFFNIENWKKCANPALVKGSVAQYPCYLGLDLASKNDIAALEMLFVLGDGRYARFGKSYLPEDTVKKPENEKYRAWQDAGLITVTDGAVTDYAFIQRDIEEICREYNVEKIAYDPYQATMLVSQLMDNDLPVMQYGATVRNFSEPMKEVQAKIDAEKIIHNGDPVMGWQMSNVTARIDAKDEVFPRKERRENKIDNPVALIMAMGCAIRDQAEGAGPDMDGFINNPIVIS